jgi:hypothetical protein
LTRSAAVDEGMSFGPWQIGRASEMTETLHRHQTHFAFEGVQTFVT